MTLQTRGPVALSWHKKFTLLAGSLPIGEFWYIAPRKKWGWRLGSGNYEWGEVATGAEARVLLEQSALAALMGEPGA